VTVEEISCRTARVARSDGDGEGGFRSREGHGGTSGCGIATQVVSRAFEYGHGTMSAGQSKEMIDRHNAMAFR